MTIDEAREVWLDTPEAVRRAAGRWFQMAFASARGAGPKLRTVDPDLAWAITGARRLSSEDRGDARAAIARHQQHEDSVQLGRALIYPMLLAELPVSRLERPATKRAGWES